MPHSSLSRNLIVCLLMWATCLPAFAQDTVIFDSSVPVAQRTIDTDNTTHDGKNIIVRGVTVTINGVHTFASLTVENSGVVTHAPGLVGGMNLTLTGNASIALGSAIDAGGKGYPGSQGPGRGADTPNGNAGGGGASYGGEGCYGWNGGGAAGEIHGSLKQPTELGSGGGAGNNGGSPGASGGGVIQLKVNGTLTVLGHIRSNGDTGFRGGAGSGGSILLNVGTLAGNGRIEAYGGYGQSEGGGGSGGRIALLYQTNNYTGFLGAPGNGNNWGGPRSGAGTVYLKQTSQAQGDLWVHNDDALGLGTVLKDPVLLDNLRVYKRGLLVPPYKGTLQVTVLQDALVEEGGIISADGRGFGPGEGPGRGARTFNSNAGGGGASYGGEATDGWNGGGAAGTVYGDIKDPIDKGNGEHLGSGGGAGNDGTYPGSAGGGAIRLTVNGTLTVLGRIRSNGNNGVRGGAGSGGSLYLNVGTLAGDGRIEAYGGYGQSEGGGGSGGRIALYYLANNFSGFIGAPGNGHSWGGPHSGAGTLYMKHPLQAQGDLLVHNEGSIGLGTVITEPTTFDNIRVFGAGVLVPPYRQTLNLTVLGDFRIEAGGFVTASGRGYGPGEGPGVGNNAAGSNAGGGGAGYGGAGGPGWNGGGAGGAAYGSLELPSDLGSGGASGNAGGSPGSAGGGAMRLTVNGTLLVDGYLTVDGASGYRGGAGSGGSLLMRVGMLAGKGQITAYGGFGDAQGGGGGGGRMALYSIQNTFTGTLSAAGGYNNWDGNYRGKDGTIYQEQTAGDMTVSLALSPTTLGSGQTATGSITLSSVAPTGGLSIALSGGGEAATVQSSITVPEGQKSANFSVQAKEVTSLKTSTIQARLWDQNSQVGITVKPWLESLKLSLPSVNANATLTGTLMLTLPAPGGGLSVQLASSDGAVTFPGGTTQVVTAGATSKPFDIKVGAVTTAKTVTLTATYSNQTISATLVINPGTAQVKSLVLTPASVVGGNTASGVVTLTKAAPTGGVLVALATSDANVAKVPTTVKVLAGSTRALFSLETKPVTSPKTALITATLGNSQTATLTVRLPGVQTLTLVPTELVGGEDGFGIVTLDAVPIAPVTVAVTSDKTQAIPDANIVIPPGETVGTFLIKTVAVTSATTALITARTNGISKSQPLSILTQGQNNNNVNLSGVITLQALVPDADTQTLAFTFRPEAGGDEITKTTPIAPDGLFSLSDIPRGRFTLHLKANKWLAKNLSLDTSNGDVSGITATLLAGDANNDNACDIFDLGTLAEDFNSSPGDGNWNGGRSDFNGDRSVDIFDLAILAENFNRQGDP